MVLRLEEQSQGKAVSSLMMGFQQFPSRKLAVIEEVWTDERHRRQGRATRLVRAAIALARHAGADCVELTVREDKPEIQAFYQSLGFVDRQNRAMRLTL